MEKEKLAKEWYEEGKFLSDFPRDIRSFLAGYESAEPKWIDSENTPNNDRTVLVKVKDYRRPQENTIEVSLGYYDEFNEWRYQDTDHLINSGHGWFIEEWIEIPQ